MSITKRQLEESQQELSQEQFEDYWQKLEQMYESPEEILDYSELADVLNFEFDLNLGELDVKKFRDNSKFIEEEDAKLIYKNLGL